MLLKDTLARLSAGLDQGDYSALRDQATSSFNQHNSPELLRRTFATLKGRWDRREIERAPPNFEIAPTLTDGTLRMRGVFVIERGIVRFDTLYRRQDGWKVMGWR